MVQLMCVCVICFIHSSISASRRLHSSGKNNSIIDVPPSLSVSTLAKCIIHELPRSLPKHRVEEKQKQKNTRIFSYLIFEHRCIIVYLSSIIACGLASVNRVANLCWAAWTQEHQPPTLLEAIFSAATILRAFTPNLVDGWWLGGWLALLIDDAEKVLNDNSLQQHVQQKGLFSRSWSTKVHPTAIATGGLNSAM